MAVVVVDDEEEEEDKRPLLLLLLCNSFNAFRDKVAAAGVVVVEALEVTDRLVRDVDAGGASMAMGGAAAAPVMSLVVVR